jgi:glycosyltransferase involved in cell wall biosynthesis
MEPRTAAIAGAAVPAAHESPRPGQPARISVIIPTLQEEKLIVGTLRQFTEELRRDENLEVIVSDGGSRDRTVELALPLADRVVRHDLPTPQTIAMGRNRGADAATGDIFVFLSADVMIADPQAFFRVMREAALRPGVAAATCNVLVPPDQETLKDTLYHGFFNWYFRILNDLGMGMGRGECHVMRAQSYRATGGYDESLAAGEDYELFLRLHRMGKIAFVRTLTVYESPRRYRRYGYFRITCLWLLNGLGVLLFKRSMVHEWKPVR